MSILNVEHLSHGFGDRAIFQDVSFRLLKGEHIGLVGANGEGKSTFFKIVTDRMMPDEGKIEWAKNVRVGYLDQHAELKKGMTIREVLSSAFSWLYEMEEKMNTICDQMGEASPEEMEQMMEELGTIQDLLTMHDFYIIDAKVEEVARALGLLELGLESDVTELSGGQRTKILLGKLLLEKTYPGRFLRAVGENPETAEFIGINSRRIKIFAYMICSFMMTVTAAFMICYNHAATPFSGSEYMSDSLIACCAGGFSLRGGNGRLEEALAAALALVIFDDGIRTLGASQGITGFIKAVMLLIVLVINFKDKLQEM